MIASHKKVAWAFLDKLLGRDAPKPAESNLTPKQRREMLDNANIRLGQSFKLALKIASQSFAKQVVKVSQKNGVHSRAIFHRLMMPQNRWPRMPADKRRLLSLMASSAAQFGEIPSVPRWKSPPELEPMVEKTMEELATWSQKTMKSFLEKAYVENLQKEARPLIPAYTYKGDPTPTLPKVTLALMHEFEWRLEHSRLPAEGASMMESALRLFT